MFDTPKGEKEMFVGLACAPAVRVGGYTLAKDDPSNFTNKHHYVHKDRAFPKEKYPSGAFSRDPVASTSTAGPEPGSLPEPPAQSKEMLIQMHRHLVKMAAAMGIQDLCTEDKATRPENILEGITSKNLVCQFCDKKLSSVTHLKTHIRSLHLRKTAHRCHKCNKYFSEASTLARHLPVHDEQAAKFRCEKRSRGRRRVVKKVRWRKLSVEKNLLLTPSWLTTKMSTSQPNFLVSSARSLWPKDREG